jgi:LysR family glycine cleavage system transcriptional activator
MSVAHDRLPLGALRVFEAVATHLNFSTAADALNVTPAAVSQQIKTLEAYIQVPLFRRNGRRVEITEEGLELLPAVRAGLEKLESAMRQIKHHGRAGPLNVSTLSSFLQTWLLPRIRTFRRKFPNVELRFHTSRDLIDFSRTSSHIAIRLGRGNYPNLHCEKLLDEWLVPVASPDLIKQYGMIDRGADLSKYPLLESGDEPWSVWSQADADAARRSRAPSIDDSAGLLTAAEEGLGYVLARWTTVARALQKGTLSLAANDSLPYGAAFYFVCPKAFLALPKVAQFREWLFTAVRDFPDPPAVPAVTAAATANSNANTNATRAPKRTRQ